MVQGHADPLPSDFHLTKANPLCDVLVLFTYTIATEVKYDIYLFAHYFLGFPVSPLEDVLPKSGNLALFPFSPYQAQLLE